MERRVDLRHPAADTLRAARPNHLFASADTRRTPSRRWPAPARHERSFSLLVARHGSADTTPPASSAGCRVRWVPAWRSVAPACLRSCPTDALRRDALVIASTSTGASASTWSCILRGRQRGEQAASRDPSRRRDRKSLRAGRERFRARPPAGGSDRGRVRDPATRPSSRRARSRSFVPALSGQLSDRRAGSVPLRSTAASNSRFASRTNDARGRSRARSDGHQLIPRLEHALVEVRSLERS